MATISPGPRVRRRWFRVSLRALMVLILLVGGGVGWVAHTIRTQRQAIAAVQAEGAVWFDYESQPIPGGPSGTTYRTEPAAPRWLRRWLGDELFQTVVAVELGSADSPAILAEVAHFDRLERLTVYHVSAGDLGYGALQGLHRLETLVVVGSGVTDASLGAIGGLRSLRTLGIWSTEATDAGFARLAALPEVTDLTLDGNSHLTDAGLSRLLAGLPALRDLNLPNGPNSLAATTEALARHHPDLASLTIGLRTVLTDADCAAIGRLTGLRHLLLRGQPITDAGLAHLGRLGHLTRLDLTGTRITAAGIVSLGRLGALESLDLEGTRLGSAADLAPLGRLPNLALLDLSATGIADAGAVELGRAGEILQLGLNQNPAITDATLRVLANSRSLNVLGVVGSGVTRAGIRALLAARPGLRVNHDNGSAVRPADVPDGP